MDLVSLLVVISVTFLSILAGAYAYGMGHLKEIKDNWVQYRCNPIYMPLAGAVGSDILSNFTHCTMQSVHTYAGFVMDPVFQSVGEIQGILGTLLNSMQFIRQKMSKTVDGFLGIVNSIYGKLQNTLGIIGQLVGRIRTLLNRIIAVFVVMLHIARSGVDSGMSIKNGPIGSTAEFLCFDPATPIVLLDGRTVPMQDVRIHDVLEGGQVVLSTMVFEGSSTRMVDVQGIRVSANHKVQYFDAWLSAWEHPDAVDIDPLPRLVCLTTNTHTIPIQDLLFLDYEETDDVEEFWQDVASAYGTTVPSLRDKYRVTGFHPTTQIRMEDGSIKQLSDIQIGDRIAQGGRVLGRFEHVLDVPFVVLGRDLYAAPGTMVFKNGIPDTAADTTYDSTLPPGASLACANLLTETAKILLVDMDGSHVLALDDQEVSYPHVHEKRDKKVLGR
jgi:hypothetical protein